MGHLIYRQTWKSFLLHSTSRTRWTSGQSISTKGSDRSTAWLEAGVGRLLLVQVSSSDGLVQKVPVFISEGTGPGVLPGQKFLMTVLVGADNLIIVENYEKY